jgi:hypothetical protein
VGRCAWPSEPRVEALRFPAARIEDKMKRLVIVLVRSVPSHAPPRPILYGEKYNQVGWSK